MELTDVNAGKLNLRGDYDCELADDQWLKIETSPRGEEVYNAKVPNGKKWTVRVSVYVIEEDA